MILDAAIPLFATYGPEVTTRQIADAAGIAEGTIFRVFSDKQELCEAAVVRYMDPEPVRVALGAIDPAASLEDKIRQAVSILRARFGGIMGMMSACGTRVHTHDGRVPGDPAKRGHLSDYLVRLLDPDSDLLRIEPDTAVHLIRLVVFASEVPHFTGTQRVTDDELVDFILHGIVRRDG